MKIEKVRRNPENGRQKEVFHMIGAIIGDIVGSRFEFHNYLSKDF